MRKQTDTRSGNQELIQRAKQQLQHMIDLLPQMIVLTDEQGTVVRVNRRMLEFMGDSDYSEILQKPLFKIFPEMTEEFLRRMLDAPDEAHDNIISINDSSKTPHLCRFNIIKSATQTGLFVVMIEDTTNDSNAAELELNHKRDAVRAVSGALQHHLNQPLTVIMVRTRLLQQALEKGNPDLEHIQRDIYDILNQTERIGDLISSIKSTDGYATEEYLPGHKDHILDLHGNGDQRKSSSQAASQQLRTLTSACNVHDNGYAHHVRETSRHAFIIARQMGLGEMRAETIRRAAFFHDIGKISVPDFILQKPGPLTNEEMAVMKTHAEAGRHLLQPFAAYKEAADVAWTHHEAYDGSGYPRGLAGNAIPLSARIVSVADAFDAMRTDRVYSTGLTPDAARSKINKQSGKQFDPVVINAFNECFDELFEILATSVKNTGEEDMTERDPY